MRTLQIYSSAEKQVFLREKHKARITHTKKGLLNTLEEALCKNRKLRIVLLLPSQRIVEYMLAVLAVVFYVTKDHINRNR